MLRARPVHTLMYILCTKSSWDTVHMIIQVVLRRDLIDGHSPVVKALRQGGSLNLHSATATAAGLHMAHTDYEVLSVSGAAPRRSCLMLIQPVTGSLW